MDDTLLWPLSGFPWTRIGHCLTKGLEPLLDARMRKPNGSFRTFKLQESSPLSENRGFEGATVMVTEATTRNT